LASDHFVVDADVVVDADFLMNVSGQVGEQIKIAKNRGDAPPEAIGRLP
jgi:hypothetical protein